LNLPVDLKWIDETAAGRLLCFVTIPFSRSMLENILRGLVKEQDYSMIKTAFKVLLTSSDNPEKDVIGEVEVETAVYGALMKDDVYDNCFILVSDPVLKRSVCIGSTSSGSGWWADDGSNRPDI
jgi:hypothetical protein